MTDDAANTVSLTPEEARELLHPPYDPTRPYNILLVEDEDLPANLFLGILRREGVGRHGLHRCDSVEGALAAMERERFDVVLLDLNLTDSEGIDTFERIRPRAAGIPVVILTGMDDNVLAEKTIEHGAQDFLPKKLASTPGVLIRVIRFAIQREQITDTLRKAIRDLEEANKTLHKTRMALAETEKMKTVGRLAAGVAHEVKNPLAILRMGLDYLNSRPNLNRADYDRIQSDLLTALSRADRIIGELLHYAAPRSLNLKPCDLNQVVREAVRLTQHTVQRDGIGVVMKLGDKLPPVHIDQQKIIQVQINLIMNAIQAMGTNGTLEIRTYALSVKEMLEELKAKPAQTLPGHRAVCVEFRDHGPGIPDKLLPRICEPFVTTKGEGAGTGLGLSVCVMIIDLHGGRLDLQNHPDGGAIARMYFLL